MSPLRRWLGLSPHPDGSKEELSEQMTGGLDSLKHARYLEAFASVLARVAYVDREISSEESKVMMQIIERVDDVSPNDAQLIVAIAQESARRMEREAGREATLLFGTFATRSQRLSLLRCLFAVAAAHDGVSRIELEEIERIGRELGLSVADVSTCRLELGESPRR